MNAIERLFGYYGIDGLTGCLLAGFKHYSVYRLGI